MKAGRSDEEYPSEPLESNTDDGYFPRRQPGEFPAVSVAKTLKSRLASAVGLQGAMEGEGAVVDQSKSSTAKKNATDYDPLRDGPLRYSGYANELGEAFVAWLPLWGVPVSYAIAITYVLVDTYDKFSRARKEAKQELDSIDLKSGVSENKLVMLLASERAIDTVVWQLLASVAIPGFTIHTIVDVVRQSLEALDSTAQVQAAILATAPNLDLQAGTLAEFFVKLVPTAVGLATIPFIVHPIDQGVHSIMNVSIRPVFKNIICDAGGGAEAGLSLCAKCNSKEDDKEQELKN